MSNFPTKAYHPHTKELVDVLMLDDYFGKHRYGVVFKLDEKVYEAKDIEFPDKQIQAIANQ